MLTGTVKWFSNKRGYGFIIQEDGTEIFVHYTDIVANGYKILHKNNKVTYDIGKTEDGRETAINVRRVVAAT